MRHTSLATIGQIVKGVLELHGLDAAALLAEQGINLQMIDTSTIRITVVIDRREVEKAVRALHDAFDLAGEAARRADV